MLTRRLILLLAAAALAGGCGDDSSSSDDGSQSDSDTPTLLSFREADFAAHRRWRARGDELLIVDLEAPDAAREPNDTGGRGVDVIPIEYAETAERTWCWQGDPDAPASHVPHSLALLDHAGREVLFLEEGQACVTQEIAAGAYRLELTHGGGGEAGRDPLFILPGWRAPRSEGDAAAVPPKAPVQAPQAFESPFGAPPALPPTVPPVSPLCPVLSGFEVPFDDIGPGQMLMARTVLDGPRGQMPGYPWILQGACADVRALTSGIDPPFPDATQLYLGLMPPDTFARIYAEPGFRGFRYPVKSLFDLPVILAFPGEPIGDLIIGNVGSLAGETGVTPYNVITLIRTKNCDRCNLESAALQDTDLRGVSLRGANLMHGELTGTVLTDAHAEGANFQSTNLRGARLRGAHLAGASFESAGPVPASNDTYPPADLSGADFTSAILTDALLRGVRAVGTVFNAAHLERADLSGAVLNAAGSAGPADFTAAQLNGALLTGATGNDVVFTAADLTGANLQGATLNGARMGDAILVQAVLARDPGRLAAAQLAGAYLANADLSSAEATGVNLRQARFYGPRAKAVDAVLINADLNGAELSGVDFAGAQLANAGFDGAKCVTTKFTRARLAGSSAQTMDGARFNGTLLYGADFSQATVSGCVFTDAIVSFGSGSYVAAHPPEFPFAPLYGPTMLGEIPAAADIICPDGGVGPCSPAARLEPRSGTPTPTATRVPTQTPTVR